MNSEDLEQIYLKYYHQVYLYALSLSGNVHSAEDLTSETFCKALLSLEDCGQSVKFWLFRVCRNLFFDSLRRDRRLLPEEAIQEETADQVWEHMLKNEEARQLYRSILMLSPNYRELVYMFYFQDCSIKEIARLTKKPEGAVKTALCRARQRLKFYLKEEEL